MKINLKNDWINALLSGDYKQGRGTLRQEITIELEDGYLAREARFCCLGVLCDIANLATVVSDGSMVTKKSRNTHSLNDGEFLALGIDPAVGAMLILLNDGAEEEEGAAARDFTFIAGYIEAAVKGTYSDTEV